VSAPPKADVATPRGGSPQQARRPERRQRNRWIPTAAALLCALIGALDVAEAVTPGFYSRLHAITRVVPGALTHAAVAATAVSGVLLLLLARGLRRRKHRAWLAVVTLLGASAVFHVVKATDPQEALIALAMLAGLVVFRHEFYAVGDPRTRSRAVGAFVGLGIGSILLGLLLLRLHERSLAGSHPLSTEFVQVIYGLVGVSGPLDFTNARAGDTVGDVLAGLGLLTGLSTVYLALRPPEPVGHLSGDDERRLRELLVRQGARDSLGYFALRRDKSLIWSPTGKAAVAYRVVSGVMLASGDPLGDPEAWPGAIEAFLDEADRHAWTPAVVGCGELGGEVWGRFGLDALELGDEAIVEVCEFSLEGRAMRNVRQAVGRVERADYLAVVRRLRDIDPAEVAHLRSQASAWRGAATERGFSMALGRFGDPADGDCVVVQAMQAGVMRAFLHFVPWGPDGLSLDLMRRDRAADNGLNEFLIVSALRAAPELGVRRISLNFAVFRSALERGERLGAGPILRGWRAFLVFVSRWFQIESLYRFNAKFRPIWEPRFVCFPAARDLPRIAVAALEAEAFIVWPRPSLRRVRRLARLG
jgi:lysyl-tRNA synthetase class 2